RATATLLPSRTGLPRYTAIWSRPADRKPPTIIDPTDNLFIGSEGDYSGENYLADVQVDVQISRRVLPSGQPERRYAALGHPLADLNSTEVHGLDPRNHRAHCQDLIAQGYRPAALSVAALAADQPLVTASVWHRPIVPDAAKERLAKRQANAAAILLRMDQ